MLWCRSNSVSPFRSSRLIVLACSFVFQAVAASAVDFDTEIIPILSRAGCNAAACHGGATGQGGFRLSLFGGDADADYETIAYQLESRRINVVEPDESLLLKKPLELVEHGGGERLEPGSRLTETIRAWITAGAPRLLLRQLERLEVEPTDVTVDQLPTTFSIRVTAHFDDGTQDDVTNVATFSSADEGAAQVVDDSHVAVRRGGRHAVIVRFLNQTVPIVVTAPIGGEPISLAHAPRHNFIDDEILATLEALRLPFSPQINDAGFLRRARLDLTGRLPTAEEVETFLADSRDDKRQRLVDHLLDSTDYAEFRTFRLAKLLRLRPPANDKQAADALYAWLYQQVRNDRPWSEVATELLLARGDSQGDGAATFHRLAAGPREEAEYVSETLLGVRLRCANCHNHPLDRWTQEDYHGLAAVFARIQRGRVVSLGPRGEVTNPRTGQPMPPKLPGGEVLEADGDPCQPFASWLTNPTNPYFARAMVNRLWRDLMGRGLIHPTDDLRATNPPTHPALLDQLAEEFQRGGYSPRHMLRLIATSAAYARSGQAVEGNLADNQFYSHSPARQMEPEVLADAIADVTGVSNRFSDDTVTRAIRLTDPAAGADILEVLGACDRDGPCEGSAEATATVATKLHVLNGALINQKVTSSRGHLHSMIDEGASTKTIVEAFYLRALSRLPTGEELTWWLGELDSEGDSALTRGQRLEDFVWSLLTCREFQQL